MLVYKNDGNDLYLLVGSGKVSGQAVQVGVINGVCMTASDSANSAVVKTQGVFSLSVVAVNNAGNSAVAVGDKLYLDAGIVNKDNIGGVPFGYALGAISSGQTATIDVLLGQF